MKISKIGYEDFRQNEREWIQTQQNMNVKIVQKSPANLL